MAAYKHPTKTPTVEDMTSYLKSNMSWQDIGNQYGMGANWARDRARAFGVAHLKGGHARNPTRRVDEAELRRLCAEGHGTSSISQAMGHPAREIREAAARFGIAIPKRRQRAKAREDGPTDAENRAWLEKVREREKAMRQERNLYGQSTFVGNWV